MGSQGAGLYPPEPPKTHPPKQELSHGQERPTNKGTILHLSLRK